MKKYRHLYLLSGWIVYFILFFLTENLIPAEKCHPVHCFLDDIIPFHEAFIIPYVSWYALIVFSLLYFLIKNVDNFKNLQIYIMITQGIAMLCYILLPSRQDLRPIVFPRDNFLTDVIKFLYAFDTNTGVCPSLHVAYSIGIASTWLKEKSVGKLFKTFMVLYVCVICISVAFVKQHSVLDIFAALPVCLIAEVAVFKNYYKNKKLKK